MADDKTPEPIDPAHAQPDPPERTAETREVHLVYEIEGTPTEVPVFELARTLEGLGNVIQEGDQVLNADRHELLVKVKPFEEGSFVMDLVLSVRNNPTVLFFLSQPEAVERIKKVLEYLGLVKKVGETYKTVLDVIDFLKNGKPAKVEPEGPETFNYFNQAGQVMPVSQPINNLINNGTIQQFIFPAIGGALQRENVNAVKTFIRGEEKSTEVRIPRESAPAIKAFSEPEPEPEKERVLENFTTEFLNPKAGTYGEVAGTWIFTKAGQKTNPFRAGITDQKFLSKYGRGSVRFYHDDLLKVRLRSEQRLRNGKGKTTFQIVEVLEYDKAPVQKRRGR